MQTIRKGTKVVKIFKQDESYLSLYCQEYQEKGELAQLHSEVLAEKWSANEKNAIKWANKQLGIN